MIYFFAYFVLICLISVFYIFEHRLFVAEVKQLCLGTKQWQEGDWRLIGEGITLRRAFKVAHYNDAARYTMPILIFVVFLLGLQLWLWAIVYALIVSIKWFLTATVIDRETQSYRVTLWGKTLFTEKFTAA